MNKGPFDKKNNKEDVLKKTEDEDDIRNPQSMDGDDDFNSDCGECSPRGTV